MNEHLVYSLIVSYLLGSIPFGLIIYYFVEREDIRKKGSGNIGATNLFRLKGAPLGVAALLLDAAKGIVPVLYMKRNFEDPTLVLLAGALAVFGHMFPVYLGFRGGKGVATFLGVTAAFSIWALPVFLVIFIPLVFTTRYVSLSSLSSACGVFFLFLFTQTEWVSLVLLVIVVLVFFRHRGNIERLLKKEEHRVGSS